MFINKKISQGFSLIEVIISIAIFSIVSFISFPLASGLLDSYTLRDSIESATQAIRLAKNTACSGKYQSAHGIFFEKNLEKSDRLIIFSGDSFANRDLTRDFEIVFEKNIELNNTFNNNELVFSKSSCLPDQSGLINLSLKTSDKNKNISINTLGIASE